jgi:bifunctional non-homologous end joining protein LigD
MCAVALKRRNNRAPVAVSGAKAAPFPGFIIPCDPTLRDRAPDGPGWLHEIKIDGYRAQVHIHHGRTSVYSRSGYNWTDHFHQIAQAVKALSGRDLIIDGEATVFGNTGLPDFQALRRELAKRHSDRLVYLAFDLLYLDGYDLRGAPLIERKLALQDLLAKPPPKIVYVEHFEMDDGEAVYRHACKLKLEGIVSKRRDSAYRSGRQETWLKLKCTKSDTFPIIAFVEKLGARPRKVASLYVGRREGDRLIYAGKARSGYTEAIAREVRERLDPLIIKRPPLSVPVKKPKATWVQPIVQAEIEYGGITDDGLLREAVFKGLRDDLPAVRAPTAPARAHRNSRGRGGVPRENILQLLPDAVAPSKEELAAYWRKVANRALPFLGHRPLKLCGTPEARSSTTKGRSRRFRMLCISCASRSVKAAKACEFGSIASPGSSGSSKWTWSRCIRGRRPSRISSARTCWCSTSIPVTALLGTSSSRPHSACASFLNANDSSRGQSSAAARACI